MDARDLVQETLLGEAVDNATVGLVVSDHEGHYLAVNRFFSHLLGYTREEFLALAPSDVSTKRPRELAGGAANAGGMHTGDVKHKDGRLVQVRCRTFMSRMAGMDLFVSVVEPASQSTGPTAAGAAATSASA